MEASICRIGNGLSTLIASGSDTTAATVRSLSRQPKHPPKHPPTHPPPRPVLRRPPAQQTHQQDLLHRVPLTPPLKTRLLVPHQVLPKNPRRCLPGTRPSLTHPNVWSTTGLRACTATQPTRTARNDPSPPEVLAATLCAPSAEKARVVTDASLTP